MSEIICIAFIIIWVIFASLKYISMFWYDICWPNENGYDYYYYIHEKGINRETIEKADEKFGRKPLGFGEIFKSFPNPFRFLFILIYRYPIVYILTALSIAIFIYFDESKRYYILKTLICFLVFGLFIIVIQRIISYLYLGLFAYIDWMTPIIKQKEHFIKIRRYQRNLILLIIDFIIINICYSFIYLGINYCFENKAFEGVKTQGFYKLIDFFYFTIMVFTTTGLGDIFPVLDCTWARVLVSAQIFTSFLYLIIIIQLFGITAFENPIAIRGESKKIKK